MEWLNYHHLLYFWMVVREGGVSRASEKLRLSQPTISGQIRALEDSLGEKLFQKVGRRLTLTDFGRVVYRYADEIFHLGKELTDTVRGRPTGRPLRFAVGIADVVPKLVAFHLLEPALHMKEEVQLLCTEDNVDRLLASLAVHEIDLVIADTGIPPTVNIRGYSHMLGECSTTVFGAAKLVQRYRRKFPESLMGAPMLLPKQGTTVRRNLDQWFAARQIFPKIVAEFQDSALAKVFGQSGLGLVVGPTALKKQIAAQFKLTVLGELTEVREQYFAISAERRLRHPAVVAIAEAARHKLFA